MWTEKFQNWRKSKDAHWSWRNDVAKFLEKKYREENPEKEEE